MPAKKKSVKKGVKSPSSAKGSGKVEVCPACFSVHVEKSSAGFVCRRCGQVSKRLAVQTIAEARSLHAARKQHIIYQHRVIRERHNQKMLPFLERFHLRMWFKIISTIILAGGIVLLFSEESLTGALFTLIGIIGLWHAVTSL